MAKAKYYLLTCETLTGEEAERIGLVSLCVDDDEVQTERSRSRSQLATGAQSRHPLDEAHAEPLVPGAAARSSTRRSAYEFFGFGGPDVAEGLASLREKRAADFTRPHLRVAATRVRVAPTSTSRSRTVSIGLRVSPRRTLLTSSPSAAHT